MPSCGFEAIGSDSGVGTGAVWAVSNVGVGAVWAVSVSVSMIGTMVGTWAEFGGLKLA